MTNPNTLTVIASYVDKVISTSATWEDTVIRATAIKADVADASTPTVADDDMSPETLNEVVTPLLGQGQPEPSPGIIYRGTRPTSVDVAFNLDVTTMGSILGNLDTNLKARLNWIKDIVTTIVETPR